MGKVTDREITDHATHERAIRELAASARQAMHERSVSARVALVRSPSGEWRIVGDGAELIGADVAVGFQVFRGETAESAPLLGRVTWATREVLRQVAGRT